jgi:hypothetical protein
MRSLRPTRVGQQTGRKLIRKQIELMRTCDDPRVVTIVTQAIIDRGAGKPRDHSNEQTQRVDTSVLTPEKREALAALLREAMGLP